MQNLGIVLAIIAGVFVVALAVVLIFVKNRQKKLSAVAILVYVALVVTLFYVEVVRYERWWAIPVYAVFLVVVPIALNYVVLHRGALKGEKEEKKEKEKKEKEESSLSYLKGEERSTSVSKSRPRPVLSAIPSWEENPISSSKSEPASGQGSASELKPEVKAEPKPEVKPELKPEAKPEVKPGLGSAPAPAPMPTPAPTPAPKPAPAFGQKPESATTPVPAPKPLPFTPDKPASTGIPAPKPAPVPAPAPAPKPIPAPAPAPAPKPTPAPAPAPVAKEITFDSCFAKADKIKDLGHGLAAADLYRQSRSYATSKQDEKKAYFAEIKCYLDSREFAKGKSCAAALKTGYELSPIESLKLDALLTLMEE
ncbi:MAG: hypothetical protein FWF45_06020 [Coriobacteriia bacterium]|nr:hypothetical protein [Coriobacteriia bacterium]